jgi:hypothetical protein
MATGSDETPEDSSLFSDGRLGESCSFSTMTTPDLSTHDISRSVFHVQDVEAFAETVNLAAQRAFPNSGH